MLKFSKGGETMKKVSSILAKLAPAITACLTLVLTISANSNSCIFMNEPKAPNSLDKFKLHN